MLETEFYFTHSIFYNFGRHTDIRHRLEHKDVYSLSDGELILFLKTNIVIPTPLMAADIIAYGKLELFEKYYLENHTYFPSLLNTVFLNSLHNIMLSIQIIPPCYYFADLIHQLTDKGPEPFYCFLLPRIEFNLSPRIEELTDTLTYLFTNPYLCSIAFKSGNTHLLSFCDIPKALQKRPDAFV